VKIDFHNRFLCFQSEEVQFVIHKLIGYNLINELRQTAPQWLNGQWEVIPINLPGTAMLSCIASGRDLGILAEDAADLILEVK
jgi:hypothetical protein